MDEIRRDWMAQAQKTQADFHRLTLLIVGGSMIALMTLTGVVVQNKIPMDLKTISAPLGWFSGSLLFLMFSSAIQSAMVGIIATFTLDPQTNLTGKAIWHVVIYWVGWVIWGLVIWAMMNGVVKARDAIPAMFDALQTAISSSQKPTP